MDQRRNINLSCLLTCIVCFSLTTSGPALGQDNGTDVAATSGEMLRVMTFNVRLGTVNDGPDHWNLRKENLVQTIKNHNPDIIGTQETWDFQAEFISEQIAEFTYVGQSRRSRGRGEQVGIFFRTSRFVKLTEGHFWLGETPDKPGTQGWDSAYPRMVTWLKLWDRMNQRNIYFVNTHFDNRGVVARKEAAKMIRQFIRELPETADVILSGDFNSGENSEPYQAMFSELTGSQSPLVDAFRVANPERTNLEGTMNEFEGKDDGDRIDWIATTRSLQITSAIIDKISFDGRFPSDHFPVVVELKYGN